MSSFICRNPVLLLAGVRGQGSGGRGAPHFRTSTPPQKRSLSRTGQGRQDGRGGLTPECQSPTLPTSSRAVTYSQAKFLESCWNAGAGCRQYGSGVMGLPKQLTGSGGWGWGEWKVGRKKPPGLARPDSCFPWPELRFLSRFLPGDSS